MAAKSLSDRVAALEAKVGSKTLEEQFREQAELIDELFAYRFEQLGKQLSPRFITMERAIDTLQSDAGALKGDVNTLKGDVSTLKIDVSTLKIDVGTLKSDVSTLKGDVSILKSDVSTLKKDMVIVREGIGILLKRRPQ
jgi:polyhydroxyalkanoate synthesis regulator phasin